METKLDRLFSLDVFRGFDMFWIMGGEALLLALAAACGCPDLRSKFGHVPWDGLQFMDTVFPTFLFLAGASFPFSYAKSLACGRSRRQIALRALRRGLVLILLGFVYQGFLKQFNLATVRIPSVLAYIGFGWMVAAWIYLLAGVKVRLLIGALILLGVTLVMGLVPAPDAANFVWPSAELQKAYAAFGTGTFSPVGNIGCWLDRTILGPHALNKGLFDNEGFGGLLSTVVTALLGMFAGDLVRSGGPVATARKAIHLLLAGVGCLIAGLLLSVYCPIIKNLWSPSFVLTVGGYSFSLFALFYWLVDVKKIRKPFFFFRVIGMNSITIYIAQCFVGFGAASAFFLGGLASLCSDAWREVILEGGYTAACWLFLLFLYKKNVFLKV